MSASEGVLFPLNALMAITADGIQTLMVGRRSFIEPSRFQVSWLPINRIVVIVGSILTVDTKSFDRLLGEHDEFRRHVDWHRHRMMAQMSIESTCNRKHSLEERIARWFYIAADQFDYDDRLPYGMREIRITHSDLADLMGARRPSVTVAAGSLAEKGAIEYVRGRVRIRMDVMKDQCCKCVENITLLDMQPF